MSSRVRESSQSWLAGQDDTLDNFFRSNTSSSKAGRSATTDSGLKRKRECLSRGNGASTSKVMENVPTKRVKTHGFNDRDTQTRVVHNGKMSPFPKSKAGAKGKAREALDDVTSTLQNSPPRRFSVRDASVKLSSVSNSLKSKFESGSTRGRKKSNAEVIHLDDSSSEAELVDDDAPLRFSAPVFRKTPRRPPKNTAYRLKGTLLTPPPSSMAPGRKMDENERDSSSPTLDARLPKERSNAKKTVIQTPSLFTSVPSRQGYPTPSSVVIPRLRFALPNTERTLPPFLSPSLGLDSDSSLTSLSSSSAESSLSSKVEDNKEIKVHVAAKSGGEALRNDKLRTHMVIPSSQTQYIHYSPTKKKSTNLPVQRFKLPSLMIIPSSQSQSSEILQLPESQCSGLSPRKTRKPTRLSTLGLTLPSSSLEGQEKQPPMLNFVVPTSQEDEMEISLLDDTAPRLSQLVSDCTTVVTAESPKGKNIALSSRDHLRGEDAGKVSISHESQVAVPSFATTDCSLSGAENNHNPSQEEEGFGQSQPQGETAALDKKERANEAASEPVPSQSTQDRIINAILDNVDRLAEEMRINTITASQVLSGRWVPSSSSRNSRGEGKDQRFSRLQSHGLELEQDDEDEERNSSFHKHLLMQSSMTEPDASQWDEDPFAPTNEAYMKHLGLHRHTSQKSQRSSGAHNDRVESVIPDADEGVGNKDKDKDKEEPGPPSTCTQSSATQPDSDDEDPFPTLPPVSTAESTADRDAVNRLLLPSQEQKHESGSRREAPMRSQPPTHPDGSSKHERDGAGQIQREFESENEYEPMPDIGSLDDPFDMRLLTPRSVRRTVADVCGASRFRRRDDRSFVLTDGDGEDLQDESEFESMPSAVRDFLGIFDSQSQSQCQSQSLALGF